MFYKRQNGESVVVLRSLFRVPVFLAFSVLILNPIDSSTAPNTPTQVNKVRHTPPEEVLLSCDGAVRHNGEASLLLCVCVCLWEMS